MAKTKIKKDRHGLYLKTDGSIFRPVQTNDARLRGLSPSGKPAHSVATCFFSALSEENHWRYSGALIKPNPARWINARIL